LIFMLSSLGADDSRFYPKHFHSACSLIVH
jgi:hypothetical protein